MSYLLHPWLFTISFVQLGLKLGITRKFTFRHSKGNSSFIVHKFFICIECTLFWKSLCHWLSEWWNFLSIILWITNWFTLQLSKHLTQSLRITVINNILNTLVQVLVGFLKTFMNAGINLIYISVFISTKDKFGRCVSIHRIHI